MAYPYQYRYNKRRPLVCSGCGETDKKLFKHIDTELVLDVKNKNRRIYQCKVCDEQFTVGGIYEDSSAVFVVREDFTALEDGFNLISDR